MSSARRINLRRALSPAYSDALRRFPPLPPDEERVTGVAAHTGSTSARQKLVRHNLALVLWVVSSQRVDPVHLEDLIQEGNLGLMRAAELFNPGAGVRFHTYAVWWVRAFVGRYLKQARSVVRPRSGEIATDDLSLNMPTTDDPDVGDFIDGVPDDSPSPETRATQAAHSLAVRVAIGKLRKRLGTIGWDVVQNRLSSDAPDSLEDIGRRHGVSRERVRQIEAAIRPFLRRHLERHGLGEPMAPPPRCSLCGVALRRDNTSGVCGRMDRCRARRARKAA